MKTQKGFSLIELLIVVVVISIIAAIAIPNLLASRQTANEGSAISTLRTYHGAQMTYQSTVGAGNFAGVYGSTNAFNVLAEASLMDSNFSGVATKSGYSFNGWKHDAGDGKPATFSGGAVPATTSGAATTGTRTFGIMTNGVILSCLYGTGQIVYTDAEDQIEGNLTSINN